MNPQLTWYIARAAGLVAWALTTAAVIWGLALSTRIAGRRPPPAWLADLHRFLGGLAVTFTAVHVIALLADDWVRFDVVDVLVPFASQWRPAAVAWGVVALYLLVAVELTSLLRRRVPIRWWRGIHLSSLPLFAAGTIHLLAAGTDATAPWLRAVVLFAVTTVVYLTAARALLPRRGRRSARARPVRGNGIRPPRAGGASGRNQPRPVVPAATISTSRSAPIDPPADGHAKASAQVLRRNSSATSAAVGTRPVDTTVPSTTNPGVDITP